MLSIWWWKYLWNVYIVNNQGGPFITLHWRRNSAMDGDKSYTFVNPTQFWYPPIIYGLLIYYDFEIKAFVNCNDNLSRWYKLRRHGLNISVLPDQTMKKQASLNGHFPFRGLRLDTKFQTG